MTKFLLKIFRSGILATTIVTIIPGSAQAIVTFVAPVTDTLTNIDATWQWDSAAGALSYSGVNWNVVIAVTSSPGAWNIFTSYQHLGGPDGETAETWHVNNVIRPFSPFSTLVVGPEHHLSAIPGSPPQHLDAHLASFGIGATAAAGGGGSLNVQHVAAVPEPSATVLMLLGVCCVAGASIPHRRARAAILRD